MPLPTLFRKATPEDALPLSVLATQVFLDTYATHGVNRDLAREVSSMYSPATLGHRLTQVGVEITLATRDEHLLAFLDLDMTTQSPIASVAGVEVFRLYVQAPFQRGGIGAALMAIAERRALDLQAPHVWLTAWAGNARALAFYGALGYADVGSTEYVIEGKGYENRVLAKRPAIGARA